MATKPMIPPSLTGVTHKSILDFLVEFNKQKGGSSKTDEEIIDAMATGTKGFPTAFASEDARKKFGRAVKQTLAIWGALKSDRIPETKDYVKLLNDRKKEAEVEARVSKSGGVDKDGNKVMGSDEKSALALDASRKIVKLRRKRFWSRFRKWAPAIATIALCIGLCFAAPAILGAVAGLLGGAASIGATVGTAAIFGFGGYGIYKGIDKVVRTNWNKGENAFEKATDEIKAQQKILDELGVEAAVSKTNALENEVQGINSALENTVTDADKIAAKTQLRDDVNKYTKLHADVQTSIGALVADGSIIITQIENAETKSEIQSAIDSFNKEIEGIPNDEQILRYANYAAMEVVPGTSTNIDVAQDIDKKTTIEEVKTYWGGCTKDLPDIDRIENIHNKIKKIRDNLSIYGSTSDEPYKKIYKLLNDITSGDKSVNASVSKYAALSPKSAKNLESFLKELEELVEDMEKIPPAAYFEKSKNDIVTYIFNSITYDNSLFYGPELVALNKKIEKGILEIFANYFEEKKSGTGLYVFNSKADIIKVNAAISELQNKINEEVAKVPTKTILSGMIKKENFSDYHAPDEIAADLIKWMEDTTRTDSFETQEDAKAKINNKVYHVYATTENVKNGFKTFMNKYFSTNGWNLENSNLSEAQKKAIEEWKKYIGSHNKAADYEESYIEKHIGTLTVSTTSEWEESRVVGSVGVDGIIIGGSADNYANMMILFAKSKFDGKCYSNFSNIWEEIMLKICEFRLEAEVKSVSELSDIYTKYKKEIENTLKRVSGNRRNGVDYLIEENDIDGLNFSDYDSRLFSEEEKKKLTYLIALSRSNALRLKNPNKENLENSIGDKLKNYPTVDRILKSIKEHTGSKVPAHVRAIYEAIMSSPDPFDFKKHFKANGELDLNNSEVKAKIDQHSKNIHTLLRMGRGTNPEEMESF